jgi:hypothetical protein
VCKEDCAGHCILIALCSLMQIALGNFQDGKKGTYLYSLLCDITWEATVIW